METQMNGFRSTVWWDWTNIQQSYRIWSDAADYEKPLVSDHDSIKCYLYKEKNGRMALGKKYAPAFSASVVENVLVSYKIQILFPRKQRRLKQHEKRQQSRHLSAKKEKETRANRSHFPRTSLLLLSVGYADDAKTLHSKHNHSLRCVFLSAIIVIPFAHVYQNSTRCFDVNNVSLRWQCATWSERTCSANDNFHCKTKGPLKEGERI